MRILLTGANGFIGHGLYKEFSENGYFVRPIVRNVSHEKKFCNMVVKSSFDAYTNWSDCLDSIDVVVHCAGLAHVANASLDQLAFFRMINVDGSVNLARQAAEAGVRRFIYISSIGVNGVQTFGTRFSPEDIPNPQGNYAQSKYEAEIELRKFVAATNMELVVVRPPLVYGVGAPGNFSRLVMAIKEGKWLPLGAVNNRRTLVSLDNLISLIHACVIHKNASGHIFLAGDAEDISTTELLRRLGKFIGKPAHLLPIPVALMRKTAAFMGKSDLIDKLCGDLQVDISKNLELLSWQPPISLEEGLRRSVMEIK